MIPDAAEPALQREDELQRRQLLQEVRQAHKSSSHHIHIVCRMVRTTYNGPSPASFHFISALFKQILQNKNCRLTTAG